MSNFDLDVNDLKGKFLIAAPGAGIGEAFEESLIFIVSQDEHGVLGVIINKPLESIDPKLVFNTPQFQEIGDLSQFKIAYGGPVESDKMIIAHEAIDHTKPIFNLQQVQISSNHDIIKNIKYTGSPKDFIFLLGYSGWSSQQLLAEILQNYWIVCPFDYDIMFKISMDKKWHAALAHIGVDASRFAASY